MVLWKTESIQEACSEGGREMHSKCESEKKCNPCAYTIAYLFAKYGMHVETAIEQVLTEISERIAGVLVNAKRDASGEHE